MRAFRLLLAAFALCFAGLVVAQVAVPSLKSRVTDLSATLQASQKAALESQLQDIEARTGSQIAVLLVPTTQPESIEQYSIRVVEAWKLGKKGVDNGILLLVAKNDRKVRIEVGYGLEGQIPDALAKRLIDDLIAPQFKQGDFAAGLSSGVQGLANLIEAPTITPSTEQSPVLHTPIVAVAGAIAVPPLDLYVNDLAGVLSAAQREALEADLSAYEKRRGDAVVVLILPSSAPETVAQFSQRAVEHWLSAGTGNDGRIALLLLTANDHQAHITVTHPLQQLLPEHVADLIVNEYVAPALKKQDFAGAVQSGVQQIENLLDGGPMPIKQDFSQRLVSVIAGLPIWLLILLVIAGTALRWFIGPLLAGLVMGGVVGGGAWLVLGTAAAGFFAGALAFVFFVVGILNWVGVAVSGSSSGSSGGGFSGGGGSFGGGGASGGW